MMIYYARLQNIKTANLTLQTNKQFNNAELQIFAAVTWKYVFYKANRTKRHKNFQVPRGSRISRAFQTNAIEKVHDLYDHILIVFVEN